VERAKRRAPWYIATALLGLKTTRIEVERLIVRDVTPSCIGVLKIELVSLMSGFSWERDESKDMVELSDAQEGIRIESVKGPVLVMLYDRMPDDGYNVLHVMEIEAPLILVRTVDGTRIMCKIPDLPAATHDEIRAFGSA
jgi:hypothetical protein